MREQIQIAAKLYECQETAQKLFGDEYKEKIDWYIARIQDYQKKKQVDTLPAVLAICSLPAIKENGMATMLFMAAAVEIIEPSKPKHGEH